MEAPKSALCFRPVCIRRDGTEYRCPSLPVSHCLLSTGVIYFVCSLPLAASPSHPLCQCSSISSCFLVILCEFFDLTFLLVSVPLCRRWLTTCVSNLWIILKKCLLILLLCPSLHSGSQGSLWRTARVTEIEIKYFFH